MADARAEQVAANEARFRQINEGVERDLRRVVTEPGELLPFICECGRAGCTAAVELTIAEYEEVRADSIRFAVLPGHEIESVEDVVKRTDRYVVVRKHPETHELARRTDPRR